MGIQGRSLWGVMGWEMLDKVYNAVISCIHEARRKTVLSTLPS